MSVTCLLVRSKVSKVIKIYENALTSGVVDFVIVHQM